MAKTVISTFNSRESAERAISDLRSKGFDKEISLVAKDEKSGGKSRENTSTMKGDSVLDGMSTGGMLGGLAGLAMGAGALAIPGIGPIVAAGPIAGLFSGAATGGIAGSLIDWGIPAERSRYYESRIKQGNIMVSVRTDENKAKDAADILRRYGSQDVEIH